MCGHWPERGMACWLAGLGSAFSYKLRYIAGFGLVEMYIPTNPKPAIYRNLYGNAGSCQVMTASVGKRTGSREGEVGRASSPTTHRGASIASKCEEQVSKLWNPGTVWFVLKTQPCPHLSPLCDQTVCRKSRNAMLAELWFSVGATSKQVTVFSFVVIPHEHIA